MEDLQDNKMFAFFQSDPSCAELYEAAPSQGWVVCVPCAASLALTKITNAFILTHILTTPPPNFSFAKRPVEIENGNGLICPECYASFMGVDELKTHFKTAHVDVGKEMMTLNGRQVFMKGNTLVSGAHFARNRTCNVLFEETCYNDNFESFQVICTDVPLSGKLPKKGGRTSNSTHSLQEAAIHLRTIHGHHKLLRTVFGRALVTNHLTESTHIKFFQNEFSLRAVIRLRQSVTDEAKKVKRLCTDIEEICLEQLQRTRKVDKLPTSLGKEVTLAIESHIMSELSGIIMGALCKIHHTSHRQLQETCYELNDIQPEDIGVRPEVSVSPMPAVLYMSKLSDVRTPVEKLTVLQEVNNFVYKAVEEKFAKEKKTMEALTADDILPLFTYVVIKSKTPHLQANLVFMQEFKPSAEVTESLCADAGQWPVLLAQLEAAIQYIGEGKLKAHKKIAADLAALRVTIDSSTGSTGTGTGSTGSSGSGNTPSIPRSLSVTVQSTDRPVANKGGAPPNSRHSAVEPGKGLPGPGLGVAQEKKGLFDRVVHDEQQLFTANSSSRRRMTSLIAPAKKNSLRSQSRRGSLANTAMQTMIDLDDGGLGLFNESESGSDEEDEVDARLADCERSNMQHEGNARAAEEKNLKKLSDLKSRGCVSIGAMSFLPSMPSLGAIGLSSQLFDCTSARSHPRHRSSSAIENLHTRNQRADSNTSDMSMQEGGMRSGGSSIHSQGGNDEFSGRLLTFPNFLGSVITDYFHEEADANTGHEQPNQVTDTVQNQPVHQYQPDHQPTHNQTNLDRPHGPHSQSQTNTTKQSFGEPQVSELHSTVTTNRPLQMTEFDTLYIGQEGIYATDSPKSTTMVSSSAAPPTKSSRLSESRGSSSKDYAHAALWEGIIPFINTPNVNSTNTTSTTCTVIAPKAPDVTAITSNPVTPSTKQFYRPAPPTPEDTPTPISANKSLTMTPSPPCSLSPSADGNEEEKTPKM